MRKSCSMMRRRPRASRQNPPSRCPQAPPHLRIALLRRCATARRCRQSARTRIVRLIFITLLALTLATVVGLGATWLTATRGTDLGTLTIGSWTARPKTGTADIDPYSRASIARSGELPVGTGDGVAFSATRDDRNRPLDGRCDVVVSGVTPAARFWTLTLYDSKGRLVANSLDRKSTRLNSSH